MRNKMNHFFLMMFLLVGGSVYTAVNTPGILEKYIAIGLKSNLVLKRQIFSLEKSLEALKEAKGKFLPSISLEARYSRAHGGRIIDVPIGDMVNPIYRTLNQLLTLHGATGPFPVNLPNQRVPFLRETEHDTIIRLIQPIFQPPIYFNVKIKKGLTGIERAGLNVFKRQLVADIKIAYFNYLKTLKVKELLDNTHQLLEENLGVSKSLFKNHKVTEDVVYRSGAELDKLEQQCAEARKDNLLSASYLNFLLNRPLDTPIEIDAGDLPGVAFSDYRLEEMTRQALEFRNELRQVLGAVDVAQYSIKLHKSSVLPTITAVVDYGFQGEKYGFGREDDYWMGSLVLSWNLFRGGQDAARKKQAIYDKKTLLSQHAELENKIKLQVRDAFYSLNVAQEGVISSKSSLKSLERAFAIVSRKYREGMVPHIEYTKARNDFTNAGIGYILAIYEYYIKEARLERVSALYEFK